MLLLIKRGEGKEGGGTGGGCGSSGYQLFSHLAVWACFFFYFGEDGSDSFKGCVHGALNVGTKAPEVSRDLSTKRNSLTIANTEKEG